MRAAVFKQAGQPLQIETVPDPAPGPRQMVMKVARCGICGTDLHSTQADQQTVPAGAVLGHEFAGEVVAVGAGVDCLRVGDRVAPMPLLGCGQCRSCLAGEPASCPSVQVSYGGFAEYTAASARESVRLPATLSLADAALIEPLSVSLHGIAASGLTAGSRVLVMGAGPIGLGVVFWARRLGASRVEVIEGVPARAELATRMGADRCTPPDGTPITAADVALGGACGNDVPDIVFECVGKPGLIGRGIKYVRPKGTVVALGFCMLPDPFIPAMAAAKEATMRFPAGYTLREFETAAAVLDSGAVEPRAMVTSTVSLDELPAAFERLRKDPVQCKVMVDPWAR